jgi:hypothetical protein
MKALIIYDDFARAARAAAALQHATWSANVTPDWNLKPWRIDVLRFPSAADAALIEAANADLIVFASSGAYPLPAWLKEWLKRWVMHREIEEVALAVIRDIDVGTLTVPAVRQLCRFAARHGLSFILEKETLPKNQLLSIPHALSMRESHVRPTRETAMPLLIPQLCQDRKMND